MRSSYRLPSVQADTDEYDMINSGELVLNRSCAEEAVDLVKVSRG